MEPPDGQTALVRVIRLIVRVMAIIIISVIAKGRQLSLELLLPLELLLVSLELVSLRADSYR